MDQLALFEYAGLDTATATIVQQRTHEIKMLARRAATDIIDIGKKLSEVKQRLGHGRFGAWLQSEFEWDSATAWRYMRVAEIFKSCTVQDLNISPKALYLLASPSTPEEARLEALERAESGEKIMYNAARQLVDVYKSERTRQAAGVERPIISEDLGMFAGEDAHGIREVTETLEQRWQQRRYQGGRAYCKYCYAAHANWEQGDDFASAIVWVCMRCDHATHDDFMDIRPSTNGSQPHTPPTYDDDRELTEEEIERYSEESDRLVEHAREMPDPVHIPGLNEDFVVLPEPLTSRINPGMYSSETDLWATPQSLFDTINAAFGFTLDVCAIPENAKCDRFFSPEQNGLVQSWQGVCWMNPPYGDEIKEWVRKAYQEYQQGATVVCLVPARTDTEWFQVYCAQTPHIFFIKSRIKFGNSTNSAPFPSCLVIFTDQPFVKAAITLSGFWR